MMWFGNLRTMWKLMLGFALTGAITAGAGVMVSSGIQQVEERLRIVYEDYTTAGTDLAHVANNITRFRNTVTLAMETQVRADFAKAVEEQAKLKEEIQKSLTAYAATTLRVSKGGRDEKRDLETFRHALDEYFAAAELTMKPLHQIWSGASKDETLQLRERAKENAFANAVPKLAAATKDLDDLLLTVTEVAKDMNEDGKAAGAQAMSTLLTSVVVTIALGLLLGYLLARSIGTRLTNVLAAAEALGSGNLAARSSVTTTDEVGGLAQSFNHMAEKLSAASVEQQRAADEQAKAAQMAQAQAAEIKGITSAIDKAQASIEFKMDGTIVTANDNFLSCTGYSLNEIKGQHHRLFCDPAYTNSPEYSSFWAKLNRGEFDNGVYRRLGKGGKEIWIQASYNPIMDANGKPYKVVKFATDITVQKNQAAEFEGKINAVNKAQAAIEFTLDGTILTANDNFLSTVGYSLNEIKGHHHRMFCEPAYSSSGEYQAFWQKLNRGEFDAGVYKRLGKGGKEIWIQASYNPIVNAQGKVYKVVKYATDITPQKKAAAEMEALVKEAQGVLGRLAGNDLTEQMTGTYSGELDKIKASINAVVQNLTGTITTVRDAVEAVSAGSQQITKGNEDLAQRTSAQAGALEETSASMEQMTSTVKQNADNAKQANQLAIAARDVADKGGSITTKAVTAMEEINKSSKKIADIITVIDEIAFQTNLLALNAAVEAARAGEHGRGFAVVATEVRNLAQRSATAAKEIKGLINESIQRVNDGSELVNQSGKTLDEIVGSVKRVTDIIAEITAASQEQAQGIDQVNKAISSMDEGTQQNAALVEETTSASQSMSEQAKALMAQVAAFKTGTAGTGTHLVGSSHSMGTAHPRSAAPSAKKPAAKPAGTTHLGAGNGHDRRKHDDFEEF